MSFIGKIETLFLLYVKELFITNVSLHPTLNSSGNLSVQNQVVETIKCSGITTLDNITCLGPLTCSGSIKVNNSQLSTMKVSGSTELRNSTATNIVASGHFYASDCLKIGEVQAAGNAHFVNCSEVKEIKCSSSLSLLTTRVGGDVIYSGMDIQINDSVIAGKLECTDKKIIIHNSTIEKIIVKPVNHSFSYFFNFFGIEFAKQAVTTPFEQVIELIGKNCTVGSIYFEEGVRGRVILKEGAKVTGEIYNGSLKDAK